MNEELTSEQAASKILSQSQYINKNKKLEMVNPANMMINDSESSVLATFEFLNSQNDNGIMEGIGTERLWKVEDEDIIDNDPGSIGNDETEEVLNEFDMILNNRMELNEHDLTNWKSNGTFQEFSL